MGTWILDLKTGDGAVTKGAAVAGGAKPDLVIKVGDADFASLYDGKSNAQQAFMKGKLKVRKELGYLPQGFATWAHAGRADASATRADAPRN